MRRCQCMVGWFLLMYLYDCQSVVAGFESAFGGYGASCKVNSDCQVRQGLLCLDGKCDCDNSFIYSHTQNICKKICRGSNDGLVKHGTTEEQYEMYKRRYTNCSFVERNLEITGLEGNFDLDFLKDIEQVDGYVLIVNVHSNYLNLTNLQIIRGKYLYKNCGLYVALNRNPMNDSEGLLELQFNSLSEIMRGEVLFINNNLLCLVNTIKWDDINTATTPPVKIVLNSKDYFRNCTKVTCRPECYNEHTKDFHCWGSGPGMCQTLSFIKDVCSNTCDGRCFGKQPNQCCHPQCAAGCTGPLKNQCTACRNFMNEGECLADCPRMIQYDINLLKWVNDPNGRYSFGSLCVKDCPSYMVKNAGACVLNCPEGKQPNRETNECEDCKGTCPKNCPGVESDEDYIHSGNIENYRGCTIVEGSIKILGVSFTGDKHWNITGLTVEKLNILKDVKVVNGYVNIQEGPDQLKNLSFLSNLETIYGRFLSTGLALSVLKMNISYLGLTSLQKISNGNVMIAINQQLCYTNNLNMSNIFDSPSKQMLKSGKNMDPAMCDALGRKCHSKCSKHGCWGPGPDKCLQCRNVRVEESNNCLATCDDEPLLYKDPDHPLCHKCHDQCAKGCHGPGSNQCFECKKVVMYGVNNTQVCLEQCPSPPLLYADENRVCKPCHKHCANGCTGPSSNVGFGGCMTCELAINKTKENGTVHCLPLDQDWCPEGYYIHQFRLIPTHPLFKRQVCEPCHHQCLKCYGPGTVNCPECRYVSHEPSPAYKTCLPSCIPMTYESPERSCEDCYEECHSGCTGNGSLDCFQCMNFKIIHSYENNTFECVKKCPAHLVEDNDPEKPTLTVCADDEHPEVKLKKAASKEAERKKIISIVVPTVSGIIVVAIVVMIIIFCWRQKERAKENTAKLTAKMTGVVEAEPLTPSDAKPDLSKLRIICESDLRRGGIIGSGAFGTVYKGFWIPDGENVKLPVAIKVLQEGTSPNQNQKLLEEARVMASVEHPCCIRILAVCMASQMMLITQLMPLGCLLDYVRKHKDNKGSKSLLNWCTQIARGMGYLEERGIVHRDLAARNVLVQSDGQVKITDFGLARLLDFNEEEYHASGGKMPIKWLALECIQHRIFTHKSDVWSYGVTAWELFTYGARPYESVRARDVPDLLEKGLRLPQPNICTIDVYMIMIKCWMLDAESRPSFMELAEEFAKMARDPGRYLVIQGDALKKIPSEEMLEGSRFESGMPLDEGDKLMRLPSYSYDKDDLARHLSVAGDGYEEVIEAEDYLQPAPPLPYGAENNNHKSPLLSTSPGASNKELHPGHFIRDKKYGHLESAAMARQQRELSPTNRLRGDSINGRDSSDPVKYTKGGRDDVDGHVNMRVPNRYMGNGNVYGHHGQPHPTSPSGVSIQLPLDEDDYLQPKSSNPNAYLDLSSKDDVDGHVNMRVPNRYMGNGNVYGHHGQPHPTSPSGVSIQLPLDEDDYLQPKSSNPNAYLDLSSKDDVDGHVNMRVPNRYMGNGNVYGHHGQPHPTSPSGVSIQLPLDEDDYLQPKSSNPNAYLDLSSKDDVDGHVNMRVPNRYMGNGNVYGHHGQPHPTSPSGVSIQLPLDEDDYLQPKSSNPNAYLDLSSKAFYHTGKNKAVNCLPLTLLNWHCSQVNLSAHGQNSKKIHHPRLAMGSTEGEIRIRTMTEKGKEYYEQQKGLLYRPLKFAYSLLEETISDLEADFPRSAFSIESAEETLLEAKERYHNRMKGYIDLLSRNNSPEGKIDQDELRTNSSFVEIKKKLRLMFDRLAEAKDNLSLETRSVARSRSSKGSSTRIPKEPTTIRSKQTVTEQEDREERTRRYVESLDTKTTNAPDRFDTNIDQINTFTLAQYLLKKYILKDRLYSFNGKCEHYVSWKDTFKTVISDIGANSAEELELLLRWAGSGPSKQINSIKTANARDPDLGLARAWDRLDLQFGSAEKVEQALRLKLNAVPRITYKDKAKLFDMYDVLSELRAVKENPEYSLLFSYLDTAAGVNPTISKLPLSLQNKWRDRALSYKRLNNVLFQPYSFFCDFIFDMAVTLNDPSFEFDVTQATKEESTRSTHQVSVAKTNAEEEPEQCPCFLHKGTHPINDCRTFRHKTLEQRRQLLKQHGICFRCCAGKHLCKDCEQPIKCDECNNEKHSTAMHLYRTSAYQADRINGEEKVDNHEQSNFNVESRCTELCKDGTSKSCAKVVLVNIRHQTSNMPHIRAYAIIDDQSNYSLAKAELFDKFYIRSAATPYSLKSCSGKVTLNGRHASGFVVESIDGLEQILLPTITECDMISDNRNEIPTPQVARSHPHLACIADSIPPIDEEAGILLLIGRNALPAHYVLDQKLGGQDEPFAQRLKLGWTIIGECCLDGVHIPYEVNTMKTNIHSNGRPSALELCENSFSTETLFSTTKNDNKPGWSQEDKRFTTLMEKEMKRNLDGSWVAPLPFKEQRPPLPKNRNYAARS